jgi:flavin-dependent dehydrogenase
MTALTTSPYDVVVVGARPAGAATAMILARAGLRVLVLDRGCYGADTLSTHALLRGGVLQLARWGLVNEVIAAGAPPVRHTVFHFGRDRIEVPIKPDARVDALYAPRRTALDPMLVDAARDAGAEVRFGMTVTRLCRDNTGRVTGVVARDSTGALFTVGARITVGADGMGSRIARLTGAPVERAATGAAAFIYGYWDRLPVDAYELFYRPGVTAGFFPTNGGQVCVFVGVSRRRFRSEARAGTARAYAHLLAEAAPGVLDPGAGAIAPERLSGFAARPGFLRRAHGPGWALVGDAGYFKDPITSHGITDALRDADLLARAVLRAAAGEAAEEDALAAYQATRDRLSERLFAITDTIASFTWDLEQIPLLLRQLSDSMRDEVKLLTELEPIDTAAQRCRSLRIAASPAATTPTATRCGVEQAQ